MNAGHSAASLVASVRGKGVQLWNDSGRLRYRAPKGALSREELERLAAASPEILALLADVPTDWRISVHEPGRAQGRRAPFHTRSSRTGSYTGFASARRSATSRAPGVCAVRWSCRRFSEASPRWFDAMKLCAP